MKQFEPQEGGHDLRLDDFIVMQQAYSQALSGLITSLDPSGTCILSGVVVSGVATLSFTSGYIAFNGEVFTFAAQTMQFLFGARIFLKIIQSEITPSSPVPYEDGNNKIVHFERVMIAKYYNSGDGDLPGVNGVYYDSISVARTLQTGFVHEFFPAYPGEENYIFDSTGLGVGRMRGYAICNGLNNAPDLRGLFTFMPSTGMFNSAALITNAISGVTVGNIFGNTYANITVANLPTTAPVALTMNSHVHTGTTDPHGHDISAHSKITWDSLQEKQWDNSNVWSYYNNANSNWVKAWHNATYQGINWGSNINNLGPAANYGAPTPSPHLSWVIDVNSPFDDWNTNMLHAQQPSGFQSTAPTLPGGAGATYGSWTVATNTSAPNPSASDTINGFAKTFSGKVLPNTATFTTDPATTTGSGILQGGGVNMIISPTSFSMIKVLRIS